MFVLGQVLSRVSLPHEPTKDAREATHEQKTGAVHVRACVSRQSEKPPYGTYAQVRCPRSVHGGRPVQSALSEQFYLDSQIG